MPERQAHVRRGVAARVRMAMTGAECERFARATVGVSRACRERLHDQLWLRAILIEQRRRTRRAERQAFDERVDRLLVALDRELEEPVEPACSYCGGEPFHGADRDEVCPGCGERR